MDPNQTVIANCTFRGIEYVVSMCVDRGNSLTVEVEDKQTADQWRASFDVAFIEDLTHRTGNYKQFAVFTSMLESALKQSTESVILDLLTYSDLESLRHRRSGHNVQTSNSLKPVSLNSKRYLIVTYTVEFDRIHYPLPLPYMGKPDPRKLQELVRELRQEIKHLRQQEPPVDKEYEELEKEYRKAVKERDEMEAEFIEYKREMKNTKKGMAAKEAKILKTMVKNLEEDLMKDKIKHQKAASKRSTEYKQLVEEVEELRISERNLRLRVKNLTNELAVYKRSTTRAPTRSLSNSRQSRASSAGSRHEPRLETRLKPRSQNTSFNDSRLSRQSHNSRASQASRPRVLNASRSSSAERNTSLNHSRSTKGRSLQQTSLAGLRVRRGSSSDRSQASARDGGARNRNASHTVTRDRSGSHDRGYAHKTRNKSRDQVTRNGAARDKSGSRERGLTRELSNSRDRGLTRELSNSRDRGLTRELNNSRDRGLTRNRSGSRDRVLDSENHSISCRSRSPSPANFARRRTPSLERQTRSNDRQSRFNPTAYVKEQERKRKEQQQKKRRDIRKKQIPGLNEHVKRRSSSPMNSLRNKASSVESLSDINPASEDSDYRSARLIRAPLQSLTSNNSSPNESLPRDIGPKILSSTPEKARNGFGDSAAHSKDYYDRSHEITEIDDRLNKLQKFLKANMT